MTTGLVRGICIASAAKAPMHALSAVLAIEGQGLDGDRYVAGRGSYNKGTPGKRQVTLINARFFEKTGFSFLDSRRNLVIEEAELMYLISRDFTIGEAHFRGQKYCEPCDIPSKLCGKKGFKETFFEHGGLVAEVIKGGMIRLDDILVPPPRNY